MNQPLNPDGIVSLTHWGLIRATGTDAAKFLQGQLTNDVASMDAQAARLAGFCSAKGRLQASFIVWRPAVDEFLLACSASVLATTLKRLSMFVMRAQCKLTDATADLDLLGAAGPSAALLLDGAPLWACRHTAIGTVIRLPDVVLTDMVLTDVGLAEAGTPEVAPTVRCLIGALPDRPVSEAPRLRIDDWRLLEVRSGVPVIESATVDRFVPQMVNFELLGGVDFQKGCYPGQEVVARSQYRGTLKRRTFLFECEAVAAPGQEVFHEADAAQPAGLVVNAAALADGVASTLLVEVKLTALDGGALRLGEAEGPALRRVALPYAVPLDADLPA